MRERREKKRDGKGTGKERCDNMKRRQGEHKQASF